MTRSKQQKLESQRRLDDMQEKSRLAIMADLGKISSRTPLELAAPDLLAALEFLVDAAKTEPGMSIYKAHIAEAEQVIVKAKGNTTPQP